MSWPWKDSETRAPRPVLRAALRSLAQGRVSAGIDELDQLLEGGMPRGKIVEIVGPDSSGKTSLAFSILAQGTSRGELVAYVDLVDSFDPHYARKMEVDLNKLLWIRCAKNSINGWDPLRKAFKSADILCQAGGFGVIVFDIADGRPRHPGIPLHSWFRLQRAIRGTPTLLLVISSQKTTGSASSLVLSVERNGTFWTPEKRSRLVRKSYFQGMESEACLIKGGNYGSATIHCRL